jgi:hypothetical protein
MEFECVRIMGKRAERWAGRIKKLKKVGTNYEFWIESRSSIFVIFGKTSKGYFACMPEYEAGCYLVDLRDSFWNKERLMHVLGKIDGITVASALGILYESIDMYNTQS